MSRFTRFAIPAVALAGFAAMSVAQKAPARGFVCPPKNAAQVDENLKLQNKYKDEILAASKLLQKDPKGYHLWDTPRGKWWIPEGDDFVLPFNLAEQERKIYGVGPQAVKAGDIVLDCGANVGVYTRLALDAGAKIVVAIEPGPENVEVLRRNFPTEVANGKVIIVEKGVWDRDDVLTLRRDPKNTAADSFVMLKDAKDGIKVPLTTIDKMVAALKLPRVDYIKMDIEGAEQKALTGGAGTLAKYHPRLSISAYHVPDDPVMIPRIVKKAWPGYTMECGPCARTDDGHIRPDVLYFR